MGSDAVQRDTTPDAKPGRDFRDDNVPPRGGERANESDAGGNNAGDDERPGRMGRSAASLDDAPVNGSSPRREQHGDADSELVVVRVDEPMDAHAGDTLPAGSASQRTTHSDRPERVLWSGSRSEQQQQHVWNSAGSSPAATSSTLLPVSAARTAPSSHEQSRHSRPTTPGSTFIEPSTTSSTTAPSRQLSGNSSPAGHQPVLSFITHPYDAADEQRFIAGAAAAARDSNRALRAEWDRYRPGGADRERELQRAFPPFLSEHPPERHQQHEREPTRESYKHEHDQRERTPDQRRQHRRDHDATTGPVDASAGVRHATATTGNGSNGAVPVGERQRAVRAGFERSEQPKRDGHGPGSTNDAASGVQQPQLVRGEHGRSIGRDEALGGVELGRSRAGELLQHEHSRELLHSRDRQRGDARLWDEPVRMDGPNDDPNDTSRKSIDVVRRSPSEPDATKQPVPAARSPPIATLESPSTTSVSPPASPAILDAGSRSASVIPSGRRSPATASSATDPASTAPTASAHSSPRFPATPAEQAQQRQQPHIGVGFHHSSGTPPYRAQRERDAGYATQSSQSAGQRATSPSSANSPAIATASAVPV